MTAGRRAVRGVPVAWALAASLAACATAPARTPTPNPANAERRGAGAVRRITYQMRAEGPSGRARGSVLAAVRRDPPAVSMEVLDPFGRLRGLVFADGEGLRAHLVAENLYVEAKPDADSFRAVFGLDLDLAGVIDQLRPEGGDGNPPPQVRWVTARGTVVLVPRSSTWGGGLVRPPSPESARRAGIEEAACLWLP